MVSAPRTWLLEGCRGWGWDQDEGPSHLVVEVAALLSDHPSILEDPLVEVIQDTTGYQDAQDTCEREGAVRGVVSALGVPAAM